MNFQLAVSNAALVIKRNRVLLGSACTNRRSSTREEQRRGGQHYAGYRKSAMERTFTHPLFRLR
jgi:hypothetical protein